MLLQDSDEHTGPQQQRHANQQGGGASERERERRESEIEREREREKKTTTRETERERGGSIASSFSSFLRINIPTSGSILRCIVPFAPFGILHVFTSATEI